MDQATDAEFVTAGGVEVPAVGLGTWRLTGEDCRSAVGTAIEAGYRHIDTAQAYGNERQVGEAIAASDVDREEIFLATKLDGGARRYDDAIRRTEESLAKLGTSYVDLLLIHWPNGRFPGSPVPVPGNRVSHGETLDAMNELLDRGKIRHIGVSNFDVDLLDEARSLSAAPVLTDQVQFHPYWDQSELLDYCVVHDLLLTAYSPLGHGGVLDDPTLADVGRRYGKSPAQVALRWVIQHENVSTIPKATSREHIEQNLDVFDFELTDAEMDRIAQPSKLRTISGFVRSRLSG
jgi:diketogulonate reductase-like aldo/keto reductase